jgi:hypothetical protein
VIADSLALLGLVDADSARWLNRHRNPQAYYRASSRTNHPVATDDFPIAETRMLDLKTVSDKLGQVWKVVKYTGLLLASLLLALFLVVKVYRECTDDGVRLDTVTVKAATGDAALTSEMAVQHVSMYLSAIMASGVKEWRQVRLDQDSPNYDIQIPGTGLSVDGVVREIAGFFPSKRRILKISITPGLGKSTYDATLSISNAGRTVEGKCPSQDALTNLDGLFQCLAITAMKSVDLLYAAAYQLNAETDNCKQLKPPNIVNASKPSDAIANQDAYILSLRNRCGFENTRLLVAEIIERDRIEDELWVPYFYGRLRLARAEALEGVDEPAQWYEYKRADARFKESERRSRHYEAATGRATVVVNPSKVQSLANSETLPTHDSLCDGASRKSAGVRPDTSGEVSQIHDSVLAIKMYGEIQTSYSYFTNAVKELSKAAKELEGSMPGRASGDQVPPNPKAQYLLKRAEESLTNADRDLAQIGPTADTLVPYLRGLIQYRRWMLVMSAFRKSPHLRVMTGEDENQVESKKEKVFLDEAIRRYEEAYALGRNTSALNMDWGNALWAARKFDCAFEKYLTAGEITPSDSAPLLNAAIALLDKVSYGASNQEVALFEALQAVADHLSWKSSGGPYDNYVPEIRKALSSWRSDQPSELPKDFDDCMEKYKPDDKDVNVRHLLERAQLKICVDQATQSMITKSPIPSPTKP